MKEIALVAIGASVPAIASIITAFITSSKTRAIIELKIETLSERVNKHNNLVERMYKVESRCDSFATLIVERRGYDRED